MSNTIKKVFCIAILACMTNATWAQKYMTFMGAAMNSSISSFNQKLIAQGLSYVEEDGKDNDLVYLEGTVWDLPATVEVNGNSRGTVNSVSLYVYGSEIFKDNKNQRAMVQEGVKKLEQLFEQINNTYKLYDQNGRLTKLDTKNLIYQPDASNRLNLAECYVGDKQGQKPAIIGTLNMFVRDIDGGDACLTIELFDVKCSGIKVPQVHE